MKNYFGSEKVVRFNDDEYKELLKLGSILENKDFSKKSDKRMVYIKTLKNINNCGGDRIMRKSNKTKKFAVAASVAVICFSLMQTSFAQDLLAKIVNSISLKHINVEQIEEPETYQIPEELKGKIFDKDGNPIKEFSKSYADDGVYTADGEKIVDFKDGKIITESDEVNNREDNYMIVKDQEKLNDYTCFKVILPQYLPEGYEFDRAEFYKGENGVVKDSKYIDLYFVNKETGKQIFMQQRFADEETAYSMSTGDKIEKVKINGIDAIISDGGNIDWENNGVLYSMHMHGKDISRSEIIKAAESVK
ncbi:DUF4367 domain-containing protein [Acidilutibacter cellobiosedens]|jgi:hypothetical protein|uniref:DUF4367 domain-containing protein n=1 Tax=Acidilutibacter cellobiosedens TaxID=2507161 RepID=A0A410QGQ9_9FIRM|nr:DUF4367 domain-containing protein [Acidilutibacter cellobiosedens]QAT63263.1 DUF4367 domain-containing protein [Acidilutibacter cellobiosedens]